MRILIVLLGALCNIAALVALFMLLPFILANTTDNSSDQNRVAISLGFTAATLCANVLIWTIWLSREAPRG